MGQRGRKSSSELVTSTATAIARPDAPYSLTDQQAGVWTGIVNTLPADWFSPENYSLLSQLCRHVVASDRIAQLIYQIETATGNLDLAEYERLLRMQDRESRAIATLATKMRLTQKAVYSARKTRQSISGAKPWET